MKSKLSEKSGIGILDESASVVQIDEHRLDKECVGLPTHYLQYSHLAAEAKSEVDEAKRELDLLHSEISKRVRNTPGKYGLEKPSEKAIESEVLMHSDYQKAQRKLNSKKHKYDLAQAVVWAMEHKKRALTLLVDLHTTGYFSEVKMGSKANKITEETNKRDVRKRHQKRVDR